MQRWIRITWRKGQGLVIRHSGVIPGSGPLCTTAFGDPKFVRPEAHRLLDQFLDRIEEQFTKEALEQKASEEHLQPQEQPQ